MDSLNYETERTAKLLDLHKTIPDAGQIELLLMNAVVRTNSRVFADMQTQREHEWGHRHFNDRMPCRKDGCADHDKADG